MTTPESRMLDDTRRAATEALDRANSRMRDLRSTMGDYTSRGVQSLSETTSDARRQVGEYAQNSGRYVAEHPMKSAIIAAAIGAAVAGLVLAWRSQRERDGF